MRRSDPPPYAPSSRVRPSPPPGRHVPGRLVAHSVACRRSGAPSRIGPRRPRAARFLAERLLAAGAAAAAVLTPRIAHAQGVGGLLRDLGRTAARRARPAGVPDSAGRPGTASAGAVASGGAVRVVEQQVTGSDSLAQRFALDTGVTLVRAAGACGAARACAAGWDLRVTRVALPGPLVPVGARVVVTAEVENRGRQPAPPSELRVCFGAQGFFGPAEQVGCGRTMLDAVALPTLAPGERAVVRHAIELPVKEHEVDRWTIAAEVDPDNTLGERDRSNNAARSAETASRLPTLQILAAELPADPRVGAPFPVTLAVRNTSTVATSPATDLQLEGAGYCAAGGNWGGGPNRVAVPALAPRQTVTYRLLVPDAVHCRMTQGAFVVRVDPDRRGAWGPGHEALLRRPYTVR